MCSSDLSAREQGRREAEAALASREAKLREREQALDTALRDGAARERAAVEGELRAAISALQAAAAHLPELEQRLVAEAEREVLRLGCALAARILRRAVADDAAWMTDLLADTLRRLPARAPVRLRLHPADAEAVRTRLDDLRASAGGEALEAVADAALARGDLRLEAGGTEAEAGLQDTWLRLAGRLLDAAGDDPVAVDVPAPGRTPAQPGGAS